MCGRDGCAVGAVPKRFQAGRYGSCTAAVRAGTSKAPLAVTAGAMEQALRLSLISEAGWAPLALALLWGQPGVQDACTWGRQHAAQGRWCRRACGDAAESRGR